MLEKFADHWDAKNFTFERIVFQPIPDTTVRLANLRSGNLDIIERLAPSDVPAVKGDSNLVFAPVSGIGYQGLTINTNNGERSKSPLGQDKRVRQAFELSIDRNVINEVVGAGIYPPAGQPFPEASPYNNPKFAANKRDVAKAKQLLKEAGVEKVKFELTFGNRHDGSTDRRDHPGDGRRGGLRRSRCGRPSSPPCRRRPRPATST